MGDQRLKIHRAHRWIVPLFNQATCKKCLWQSPSRHYCHRHFVDGSVALQLLSRCLQPLGPQPVSRGETAWWREMGESRMHNGLWQGPQPAVSSSFTSAISAMSATNPFASGWQVLCCRRARGGGFQGIHQVQAASASPSHLPSPDHEHLCQVLKHLGLSNQLEMMALVHLRAEKANHITKKDPPVWRVTAVARTPHQTTWLGNTNCPNALSYPMSFLLRKEHMLLRAVLRKGKNRINTLGGSSLQHKPKVHFVWKRKDGQICLWASRCY